MESNYMGVWNGMNQIPKIKTSQLFKIFKTNLQDYSMEWDWQIKFVQKYYWKKNLHSVNQMNAQCKLLEIWKASNKEGYPFIPRTISRNEYGPNTRACSSGMLVETARTNCSQKTFRHDTLHIWNKAPQEVKDFKSLFSAKKAIKSFVSTLPQ